MPRPRKRRTHQRPNTSDLDLRRRSTLLVAAVYVAIAVVAYWDVWTMGPGQYATGVGGDIGQSMWFLTWVPFALLHGHNPFFSSYANYPHGVNLLMNTSAIGVGLLVAPVTLLFGPVVSFNLAMTAAMALSAFAAFVLARRFTNWVPAAFAAGLLYGFSPYMDAEGLAHTMALFVPLPPLILLVVHDIVVRQRGRPIVLGTVLGVLVAAQFLISVEVLADLFVLTVLAVAIGAVMGRREVLAHLHFAGLGFGAAVVCCVVLLAYPTWIFLAGPGHIVGSIHLDNQIYSANLLGPVVPNFLQRFAPASLFATSANFGGNVSENGSYLGVPLIVVVVAGVIWLRRFAFVRLAGILCALAFVLSLGAQLRVANHVIAIPLPETLLRRLPLVENAIPVRFSLFVVLFASVVLAAVLDRLHAGLRARRHGVLASVLPAVLAVVVFVPLVPIWPYGVTSTAVPSFFSSSAVGTIPNGGVVLTYPYPDAAQGDPEYWQATTFMHFKIVGGRFKVAQPGRGTAVASVPSEADTVLSALLAGTPLAPSPSLKHRVDAELQQWQVHFVVAVPPASNERVAIPYLTWLLGGRPTRVAGAWVWYRWDE